MFARPFLLCSPLFCLVFLFSQSPATSPREDRGRVTINKSADEFRVAIAGKPFFTYRYNTDNPELPRPVIHPLYGPGGEVITQLGQVPGTKKAHFHHTGLWISHQKFTRGNNWQMDANPKAKKRRRSRILHRKFESVSTGKQARFTELLDWDSIDGKTILLKETRTITVPDRPADRRVIDFDIELRALKEPVILQRTPYHILAVRAVNSMVPAFNKEAVITNSEGKKNPRDGAVAKWIDVTGQVNGKTVGISLFNHPQNFRHPTPCLSFAKQTIGLSPTHKKSYTIEPGKSLRLRFRVLVHAGTASEAGVAEEYARYCKN